MRISHWSSDVCSSDLSPSRRRVAISCASSRKRSCWVSQLSASRSSLEEKQALSRRSTSSAGFTASGEANTTLASSKFQKCASSYSITRSEEHTSELQSLMRISYAVFCLKKKNNTNHNQKPKIIPHI